MSIDKKNNQKSDLRVTIRRLAVYTTVSVLGPIVIFLGIGIYSDDHFQKRFLFKLISVGVAFVFTNIFLFRKAGMLKKKMVQDLSKKVEK